MAPRSHLALALMVVCALAAVALAHAEVAGLEVESAPTSQSHPQQQVDLQVTVASPCAVNLNCTSCTQTVGCAYCAHVDAMSSCQNATTGSCGVDGTSTWVNTPSQCAKPGDSCANYQLTGADCEMCNEAPLELNCGFCASGINGNLSNLCVPGRSYGPVLGSCPFYSWSMATDGACLSNEAKCNQYSDNTYGCTGCINFGTSCGYCRGTQTCKYTTDYTQPADGECAANQFAGATAQCAGPGPNVTDPCALYSNSGCGNCAAAPSSYNCGYCVTTGQCSTGNYYGPTSSSNTCTYSNWQYQTCSCSNYYDCSSCASATGCGWCGSTTSPSVGQCLASNGTAPSPGGTQCSLTFTSQYYQCPAPAPWIPADFTYPAAGTTALTMISIISMLLIIRLVIAGFVPSQRPRWGQRLQQMNGGVVPGAAAPRGARDYSSCSSRLLPAFMILPSLILKLVSLGVDVWDRDSSIAVLWGLVRIKADGSFSAIASQQWTDYCAQIARTEASGSLDDTLCSIGAAGGILTLIMGICATIALAIATLLLLIGLVRPPAAHRSAMAQWHLAGLAATFSAAGVSYWLFVGHMMIHHMHGDAVLATSWVVMLVSLVFDLAGVFYYRRAVECQVEPPTQPRAGALAYTPLQPGAPVRQQQQQVYQGQPNQMPAPYGYGLPQQQHQQQQPGAYPNQQQQQQQQQQQYQPGMYAPAPQMFYGQPASQAYQPPVYAPRPQAIQQAHPAYLPQPIVYGSAPMPANAPNAPPAAPVGRGENTTQMQ